MAKEIRDYLTKQLFIEKNIVTFRSLSRQFKIHVNQAKNELDAYYQNPEPSSGHAHATYLVCGELTSVHVHDDAMDVDEDVASHEEDGEQAPEIRMTLVGEQDLDSVKSSYTSIFSQHVYCLSPSAVIDAGLICAPSDKVRETDAKLKQDEAAELGRVIGPHVRKGKPVPHTALPRAKEALSRKPTGPGLKTAKTKEEPAAEEKPKEPEKPAKSKQSGLLDWGKAKPKQPAKVEEKKPKFEEKKPQNEEAEKPRKIKAVPPAKPTVTVKEEKDEERLPKEKPAPGKAIKTAEPIRGVKRKSALKLDTDSDEDADTKPSSREKTPEKPQAKSGTKLKKMVVVSDEDDDDDDEPVPLPKAVPKRKLKAKPTMIDSDDDEIASKTEASLRAMMDIDDDHVIRISRQGSRATSVPTSPEPEPEPETEAKADASSDGDVEMADSDLDVKPKQVRKRKEKKVIPLGSNGLKKRRVVKSRRERDAKGFLGRSRGDYP
ncbi:hypothetical protein PHLGIDRAFT_133284 [Phlebiopsis gigantea 11061_1 CR5-6]|uniref:DNA polymerase delta subunit 3 n=1 Tax=Phlebiopsis gigantea (strain 11061_1 CR5-6) TaxID=745531 RepID=A0A0C3S7Y6_PHLG1|nr:hypothetical protein PHLGIDRAFT_133284 [Phlebiopsis gigantea 11061_1 CR5-6]